MPRRGARPAVLSARRHRPVAARAACWLLAGLVWLAGPAYGYEPEVHQRLTFVAAKTLNRCVEGGDVAPLTPLQVRFIANSNMGLANTNAFVRMFRWGYYDVAGGEDRRFLWVVNTRFLDHFDDVTREVRALEDETERYEELGRIVGYVQLVSAPSRAVPVYTARWWRWSFGDRFDSYRLDGELLEAELQALDCGFLQPAPDSYRTVLEDVAHDTLEAVRSPLGGLPTTWEAFWQPARKPGDFGDYGRAGNNYGKRVSFRCRRGSGDRCVLLEDDPLYQEFALARQLAAVRGTVRAMYLHQLRYAPALPVVRR